MNGLKNEETEIRKLFNMSFADRADFRLQSIPRYSKLLSLSGEKFLRIFTHINLYKW